MRVAKGGLFYNPKPVKPYFATIVVTFVAAFFVAMLFSQVPQSPIQPPSGPWECVDRAGVHGIFFEFGPTDPQIFVYERRTGATPLGGYFSTDRRYKDARNRVTFLGYRLAIHFEYSPTNRLPFDLDLVFDPARDRWTGSWSDCDKGKVVVLDRPRPVDAAIQHVLVGDWTEERTDFKGLAQVEGTLHIRQSADGQFVTWLTRLDGFTVKVHLTVTANTVALAPDDFFSRRSSYEGRLSQDRETIAGQWIYEGLRNVRTDYRRQPPKRK